MHPDYWSDSSSSSSSCSAASPGCSPRLPSPPARNRQDAADCVVPCAGAPSVRVAPAAPSKGRGSHKSSNKKAKSSSCKKGHKDKASKEEDERRRIRRERNKIAAAKCRNRRRELMDTLQAETEQLEDEKWGLQSEIEELLKEKGRLERVLSSHEASCQLDKEDEDEEDAALQSPPSVPVAAISGNSDILLCASAQDESLRELEDDLDDLVPNLEMEVGASSREAAAGAFVPDAADPDGPLGLPDWETLYRSVADDLDCLAASSCAGARDRAGVFSFDLADVDALAEGGPEDRLDSPTLLVL